MNYLDFTFISSELEILHAALAKASCGIEISRSGKYR